MDPLSKMISADIDISRKLLEIEALGFDFSTTKCNLPK